MPVIRKSDLPDEYVPKSLRPPEQSPPRQEGWACGYKDDQGGEGYAMFAGPFPSVFDALEVVPQEAAGVAPPTYLIHFLADGTEEIVYRWNSNKHCWYRYTPRG